MISSAIVDNFLEVFERQAPLFFPSVRGARELHADRFDHLAAPMLNWAKSHLGDDWASILVDGYKFFVTDVNRSQMRYEREGKYRYCDYEQVNKNVYSNASHMSRYHWGVYVTTFAWEHHLRLFQFFEREFLARVADDKDASLVDLGAGSAIWSLLTANNKPNLSLSSVDISSRSVELARSFIRANGFQDKINMLEGDALTYRGDSRFDYGISCFLLEHLEKPERLFQNLYSNLKSGALAFLTGALTASEIDHIYEFKRESELILMAEEMGFRVLATSSCNPNSYVRDFQFLPRSMALVCQKRGNDIW
jgi:2-polyprenyl-3-methyl-5-hydroxy-6-metoxy-1,4-benzoquinol methylase